MGKGEVKMKAQEKRKELNQMKEKLSEEQCQAIIDRIRREPHESASPEDRACPLGRIE